MASNSTPAIFKLLSNDVRWKILTLLSRSDLRVQEITEQLHQPQNLVSYHLQKLHTHGLILEHPSIADGREIYYQIHLSRIRELFQTAQLELHPSLAIEPEPQPTLPKIRVLFLCTHNSARSQMAEGFLRAKSHQQFQVFSAGTDPKPVNPNAIQSMLEHQIDISNQQSKSLDQYLPDPFDYIITVCDRARENCPAFPAQPVRIHWSLADPAAQAGSNEEQYPAFRAAAEELEERVDYFIAQVRQQTKRK